MVMFAASCGEPRPAKQAAPAGAMAAPSAALAVAPAAPATRSYEHAIELVESFPEGAFADDPELPNTGDVWLEMISGARRTVALGQFYVSNAPAGGRLEPVLSALGAAVARGVEVRFLVDATFAAKYPADLERLERMGIELRRLDAKTTMGGVHHAKYLIVDGSDAYLGSANFDWRSLEHIHELGLRLRSAELGGQLASVFERDWVAAAGERTVIEPLGAPWSRRFVPVVLDEARVELVASPKGHLPDEGAWDLERLVLAIDAAKRELLLQLLSYDARFYDGAAFTRLDDALVRAHSRGVRVRVLLSSWQTAKSKIHAAQSLARRGLDVRIVTVPDAAAGFIPFARVVHAKYLVIDRAIAWVGTSNFSGDYFTKSRNVGAIVTSSRIAAKLGATFDALAKGPLATPVDPAASYPAPRIGE